MDTTEIKEDLPTLLDHGKTLSVVMECFDCDKTYRYDSYSKDTSVNLHTEVETFITPEELLSAQCDDYICWHVGSTVGLPNYAYKYGDELLLVLKYIFDGAVQRIFHQSSVKLYLMLSNYPRLVGHTKGRKM